MAGLIRLFGYLQVRLDYLGHCVSDGTCGLLKSVGYLQILVDYSCYLGISRYTWISPVIGYRYVLITHDIAYLQARIDYSGLW